MPSLTHPLQYLDGIIYEALEKKHDGKVRMAQGGKRIITVNILRFKRKLPLNKVRKSILSRVLNFQFLCRKAQLPRPKVFLSKVTACYHFMK